MLPDGMYATPTMPQGGGQIPLPAGPQIGGGDDALWAMLEQKTGLPRAELESMLSSTTTFPEQSGMLGQDMSMADRLRQTPMPDMRQAGRVQVAASPLEAAASVLQRVKGEKEYGAGRDQMQSLIDMLRKGRTTGAAIGAADAGGY
jgi:hypothetical protein